MISLVVRAGRGRGEETGGRGEGSGEGKGLEKSALRAFTSSRAWSSESAMAMGLLDRVVG